MKILQTISAVTFLGILSLSGQDVLAMETLEEAERPAMGPVPRQIGGSTVAEEHKEEAVSQGDTLASDLLGDQKKLKQTFQDLK